MNEFQVIDSLSFPLLG